MAVAQLPAQAIALPRRTSTASTRSNRAGYAAWVPLVGVLMGIASLFYIAQTSELATTGYSIQGLQSEEANWKLRNEQLSLDLSRAKSLPTIESQATGRLLMVPAKDPVYLKATPVDSSGPNLSNRGDFRSLPALGKTAPTITDPLDPVRFSLSSLFVPRPQPPQR
jgi:hypothetical protein